MALLIWLIFAVFGVANGKIIHNCDTSIHFKCPEDGSCIDQYKQCNGAIDCPNGSDETFVECKEYFNINKDKSSDNTTFFCANGAFPNDAQFCDNNLECSDGSDELLIGCSDATSAFISGNCSSFSMQCHSGDCIPMEKMCNGHIDCIDGRDESLELCYSANCDYPYFQCSNGQCIDPNNLCNNKFDCIDGSDELPRICEHICGNSNDHEMCEQFKGWNRREPPRCFEPIEKNIEFTNTKFQTIDNKKFVYANGIVQFKCKGQKDNTEIEGWNVCLNTGKWRNPLPRCLNMNAATNGSLGCPLNYYNEDKMKISQCEAARCEKPVQLPLNNMKVKIECNHGYSLASQFTFSTKFVIQICSNKTWIPYGEPKCTKYCNGRQISNLYALDLECKECFDNENVIPGVLANFSCSNGFIGVKNEPLPQLECLEDGLWQGLDDLKKTQHKLCSYNCMNKKTLGFHGIAAPPSSQAPWTVAIYRNDIYLCAGTLIRLDLVLTVAHCLQTHSSESEFIHKDKIFVRYIQSIIGYETTNTLAIQDYRVHSKYSPNDPSFDVAILFLKRKVVTPRGQGIVCLPWLRGTDFTYPKTRSQGVIDTWTANGNPNVVPFSYLNNSVSADLFYIKANGDICKGDSGSPVVVECKDNEWSGKCLIGLVTSNQTCSDEVTVLNISNFAVSSFIRQFEEYILDL